MQLIFVVSCSQTTQKQGCMMHPEEIRSRRRIATKKCESCRDVLVAISSLGIGWWEFLDFSCLVFVWSKGKRAEQTEQPNKKMSGARREIQLTAFSHELYVQYSDRVVVRISYLLVGVRTVHKFVCSIQPRTKGVVVVEAPSSIQSSYCN